MRVGGWVGGGVMCVLRRVPRSLLSLCLAVSISPLQASSRSHLCKPDCVCDVRGPQINVTDSEYYAIMLATIKEVWSRYPNAITEIW